LQEDSVEDSSQGGGGGGAGKRRKKAERMRVKKGRTKKRFDKRASFTPDNEGNLLQKEWDSTFLGNPKRGGGWGGVWGGLGEGVLGGGGGGGLVWGDLDGLKKKN